MLSSCLKLSLTNTYTRLWEEEGQSHLPSSAQLQDVEHNQADAHREGCCEHTLSAYHPSF